MDAQPPVPPDSPSAPPPDLPPPSPLDTPPVAPPPPPPDSTVAPLPWEREGATFPDALFATIGLFLARPREAYQRMSVTGSYARPIVLALVLGIFGVVVSALYEFAFHDLMASFTEALREVGEGGLTAGVQLLVSVLGSPFFVAIAVLLTAGLNHLFLMLFGASAGGLGATFRVVCYSLVPSVFALVPFLGQPVGGVWCLVLCIVGYSVVHRASLGRTAAAVLVPLVLCCTCCAPFFFLSRLGKLWN